MLKRSTLIIASALALSGCISTGQPYQAPAVAAPAQWQNAAQLTATTAPAKVNLASWWQTLGDPALNRLIATALAQNYDLKTAQAKLREARSRAGISEAALYPSLDASLGARRSGSGAQSQPTYTYSTGLDASWELDIFGTNQRSLDASKATAEASAASLQDAQVSLVAEVAQDYISLRTLEARKLVANNNLVTQQETRDLTHWRWQAGLASELDALQADSTLAQSRAKIPALESQIEETRNQLAVLLGLQPAAMRNLLADSAPIPDFSQVANTSIPLDLLRQRPDLRALERKYAAQLAQVDVAKAARYPKLSLSGSISLQSNQLGQLLRYDSMLNSLAANLTAPIFDAGRIRENIAVQDAVLEQTLIAYEKAALQALADVENALMALAKTEARRTELRAANDAAVSAESIARQRYAAGLIDHLSVLDTQRTLLSVQDSLRSVDGDRATALVQLYKALGGGWSDEAVKKP